MHVGGIKTELTDRRPQGIELHTRARGSITHRFENAACVLERNEIGHQLRPAASVSYRPHRFHSRHIDLGDLAAEEEPPAGIAPLTRHAPPSEIRRRGHARLGTGVVLTREVPKYVAQGCRDRPERGRPLVERAKARTQDVGDGRWDTQRSSTGFSTHYVLEHRCGHRSRDPPPRAGEHLQNGRRPAPDVTPAIERLAKCLFGRGVGKCDLAE